MHIQPSDLHRVAVLEDDPSVTRLLARILGRSYEMRFARDGAHLRTLAAAGLSHLVLLDLMLPGEDGMEVGRALRARSDVPIVILSGLTDSGKIAEALDAFADDYVTKPFAPEVLRSRVASVLRRSAAQQSSRGPRASFDVLIESAHLHHNGRTLAGETGDVEELTEREFQLLVHLCRNAGRVVTRDELSVAVCGRKWEPADRSLDVHVYNMRAKLSRVLPGRRIIRAARGAGYSLDCAVRFVTPHASGEAQEEPA
jgi:DNA-binding response OmpR family regulator